MTQMLNRTILHTVQTPLYIIMPAYSHLAVRIHTRALRSYKVHNDLIDDILRYFVVHGFSISA